MKPFSLMMPRTLKHVLDELSAKKGGPLKLKAGGIDLLDLQKEGLEEPDRVVNLRGLQDSTYPLTTITEVKAEAIPDDVWRLLPGGGDGLPPPKRDCLRLGALTSLADIAAHPLLQRQATALCMAVSDIATPQIRHMATLGGNLFQRPRCFYFRSADYPCAKKGGGMCFARDGENDFHAIFDNKPCAATHPSGSATALVALDAIVQLLVPDPSPSPATTGQPKVPQNERFARLSSFLVAPNQPGGAVGRENRLDDDMVLVAVWIPSPLAGEQSFYRKVKQKQSFDWPLCEVAVHLRRSTDANKTLTAAKIILGSVAPVPYRARYAESLLLKSQPVDANKLQKIGQAATQGATPLSKNGYKVPLLSGLVQETLAEVLLLP
ncbi:MAG TPA: FAD binding domain-containing protein [Pseudomonadota bacterium]|nr:FAD binding domain-containing protein [Pseudomonadota bacterium]